MFGTRRKSKMTDRDSVRRYEITAFGEANTLQEAFGPMPEVSADLVRIRVHYAGLNFADVMARRGLYPLVDSSMLPYTPGMEVLGEIEALGPDVSGLNVGQRVFAKLEMGGYSDYVVAPASYVFRVPDGIDSAEVLGLVGTSGQTAYGAAMSLKPADARSVFITAAAGGVGSVLIQLCKHLGWTVIAGVSSAEKAAFVASLGADQTVRYDQTGWEDTLKRSCWRTRPSSRARFRWRRGPIAARLPHWEITVSWSFLAVPAAILLDFHRNWCSHSWPVVNPCAGLGWLATT